LGSVSHTERTAPAGSGRTLAGDGTATVTVPIGTSRAVVSLSHTGTAIPVSSGRTGDRHAGSTVPVGA
jgi:hypothetical protein